MRPDGNDGNVRFFFLIIVTITMINNYLKFFKTRGNFYSGAHVFIDLNKFLFL